MSEYHYPQPIKPPYGAFTEIADLEKAVPVSTSQLTSNLDVKSSQSNPLRLNSTQHTGRTGVMRVILFQNDTVSISFNNNPDSRKDTPIKPFHFCPGVDQVKIGWELLHPAEIESAVLEFHTAKKDKAIAKKDLASDALTQNEDTGKRINGSTDLSELVWDKDFKEDFPDSLFTVEYSPYQIVLKITRKEESSRMVYADTAWTFFHVLVSKINVDFGEKDHIPARDDEDVIDDNFTEDDIAETLEKDLLDDLKEKSIVDELIEVVLDCNLVKGKLPQASDLDGVLKENGPGSHAALKAVWGKGPRVPLTAKILVKKLDGSDASEDASKKALGRPWFLWDWRDYQEWWKQWVDDGEAGNTLITKEYLEQVIKEDAEGTFPYRSGNCPAKYGGRRGDADWPIFPDQEDTGTLGYEVTKAGDDRPWAARSRAGSGEKKGTTGAIFHPSSILGDNYTLYVWPTSLPDQAGKDDKPCLIRPDKSSTGDEDIALIDDVTAETIAEQRPPVFISGRFVNYRQSKLKLIYEGELDDEVIEGVMDYYKKALGYIIDVETVPLAPDIWHQNNEGDTLWKNARDYLMGRFTSTLITEAAVANPQPDTLDDMLIKSKSYAGLFDYIKDKLENGDGYCYFTNRDSNFDYIGQVKKTSGPDLFSLAKRGSDDDPGIARGIHLFYYIAKQNTELNANQYMKIRFKAPQIESEFSGTITNLKTAEITFSAGSQSQNCNIEFASWSSEVTAQHNEVFEQKIIALGDSIPKGLHDLQISIKMKPAKRLDLIQKKYQNDRVENIKKKVHSAAKLNRRYTTLYFDLLESIKTKSQGTANPLTEFNYLREIDTAKDCLVEKLVPFLYAKYPDYEGLIYVIIERPIHTLFSVSGAFYITIANASRGLGHHESGGANSRYVGSKRAFLDEAQLFIHELGHAFWRGHAYSCLFSTGDPGGESTHVEHDTCIMNYDPDPASMKFCGRCILEMRGWKDLPESVEDLNECKAMLEDEIGNTSGSIPKAWKQMRRAFLAGKESNWADVETWIEASLHSWATGVKDWKKPHGLALLREALVGFKKAGKNTYAKYYWDTLVENTDKEMDRLDDHGVPLYP